MIHIRRANVDDCRACWRLSRIPELRHAGGDWYPVHYFQAFIRERQDFLVAVNGRTIVGYIAGERITGDLGLIQLLAVRPAFQRRGIGSKLVLALEQRWRKRGLFLAYGVAPHLKKTLALYRHLGYTIGPRREHEIAKLLQAD